MSAGRRRHTDAGDLAGVDEVLDDVGECDGIGGGDGLEACSVDGERDAGVLAADCLQGVFGAATT
jgi:hypothetical protein